VNTRDLLVAALVSALMLATGSDADASEWSGYQTVPGTESPNGGKIEYRVKMVNKDDQGEYTVLYQYRNAFDTMVDITCDLLVTKANGATQKSGGVFHLAPGNESHAGVYSGNVTYAASVKGAVCQLKGATPEKKPSVDTIEFPGKQAPHAASPKPDEGAQGGVGGKTTPEVLRPTLRIGATSPLQFGKATSFDGSIASSREVTVSNDGKAPLAISSITLGGNESAHFKLWETLAGKTLKPGQTANFTVSYAPKTRGSHLAVVTVTTNDPAGPQRVGLFGYSEP
jgi:hypothetical protein